MDSKGTFNIQEAIKAQAKLCKEENLPHFAPGSGICWRCHRNIYEQVGWKSERLPNGIPIRHIPVPIDSPEVEFITGITVEKASSILVTGCPHCNRSYCD